VINQVDTSSNPLTQPVSHPLTADFIEQLAQSPRGDHRVIAAVLRIGQESAEAEAVHCATISQPAIATGSYADDGPVECFDPSEPSPEPSPAATVPGDIARNAVAAHRLGMRVIRNLRAGKATNLASKSAQTAVKPIVRQRAARSQAVRSHAGHGSARKAADDGGDGDGDGGKPSSKRRKPEPKRRGPRQIEVGWTRFNQFPSSMGRKVAPGECNYASSAALMVAVIGRKHDRQTGSIRTVRSVSTGKITTVVLGALVETHERIPISFYKFRRISSSAPEAIAVRS
jgi:hypothetical protein